ncbi:4-hydroxy-tetrahydrodipicolinate synthase [Pseudohongiella spirulinae]|uniref:4-hydroxy-tetrahydrodipicolinate synthase n=1 Tax=Pseudohongiella spirulinae TaxID=1249552 RepID=A0A0S2KEL3_9GAMM|nr:4-hydroxy-tetrahydrodipicolinate synthase [Pseudohongiella spirulinae]ALO46558.1 dihydrodipicolinate synthase [Pseudohongiella spirulinae]
MIQGSIVAIVTPMFPNGDIDFEAFDRLLEWHVESGTDAVVVVGTTGESPTLTADEHVDVIARAIKTVKGRIPVIAGTGSNSTSEAIYYTKAARETGADACLLVTPYYNRPSQEGLYQHFKKIAEEVDIPQILYNVPSRTGCDMLPETVSRLADVDNIIGIKEATGDLDRGQQVITLCAERIAIYSGDDATALDLILAGAKGNISVTANVAPAQMHEMCRLALAGEYEKASLLNARLAGLHNALFLEANPIPVKWALAEMGYIQSGIRLPLVTLNKAYHIPLREALRHAGLD